MESLEIGKPYIAGRRNLPEGAGYCYAADGHVLSIFMCSPDRRKVEAVRKGKCQFGLTIGAGVFFLMYRFGKAIGWSAAPYWNAITPNDERAVPPEASPGGGIVIKVVLVDALSGLVRCVRPAALPPGFSCELNNAIRQQALLPSLDKNGYNAALASMRQLCPTNRRLLQRAEACTGPVPREKLVHRISLREHRLNLLLDLLEWLSSHSYDKQANLYIDEVMRVLDKELMGQGFMRVDRSFEIPHD
jgi:hypothetical protein